MVKAVARTLGVIEAFTTARRPLSLSELARAIRVPVASCFAIARTLERRGYLKRVEDRAVYLDVLEGSHTVRYAARQTLEAAG